MRFLFVFLIFNFFYSCSFDNRSGIWKNINDDNKKRETFEDFKLLSSENKSVQKNIFINKNFKFKSSPKTSVNEWHDKYYSKSNNFENFRYLNKKQLLLKSNKITKHPVNDYILYDNENIISSDNKGNIIVYSLYKKEILTKYNFYKKQYKKIDKYLNLITERNIIYISDNIGFLYAFDYKNNKILWAKNYKVPFSSNLKIFQNRLIAANTNNDLLFFDKQNGQILGTIPTESTTIKNNFLNNLSLSNKTTFYLNTYGSLYAIDNNSMRIKWFLNLNRSTDLNFRNLFLGSQVINDEKNIIVSGNNYTYIINANSGEIIFKKNFSSFIKPLVSQNYLFLISKENFLISVNLNDGNIIYSYDLNEMISKYFKIKKKGAEFKDIFYLNDDLFLLLENSFTLKVNLRGEIKTIGKLPDLIGAGPIFVKDNLLFISKKNKIYAIN